MEYVWPLATWYNVLVYIIISFVGWYLILALEYELNGGGLGRGRYWVFECFWEEFLENIPGGMKRKVEKLKEMVGPPIPNVSGTFVSMTSNRSWTYEELRSSGKWEECAREMFGGPWLFWFVTVSIYFLIGAPAVIIFLAALVVGTPIFLVKELIRFLCHLVRNSISMS